MKCGGYELTTLIAGTFALDGGAMFGIIPKPLWSRSNPADDRNRIPLATRLLLIEGDGRKILVDTGNGDKWTEKYRGIYKIQPLSNGVVSALYDKELKPEDISDVILTHLHFDHAGGATIRENGRVVPAFPNASYHIQRDQWEWANNPSEKDAASYIRENFVPMKEHGVLHLVEGETELFPGLEVLTVHGHTAGQQLPLIRGSEKSVLYTADLIPTKSHVPLPWVMGYDNNPLITIEEKKRLLTQAARKNWVLILEHDPDTGGIMVETTEKGFQYKEEVPTG